MDPNDPNYESDPDAPSAVDDDLQVHVQAKNGGQSNSLGVNGGTAAKGGHGTTLKTMVPEMSEEDVNKGNNLT